MKGFKNTSKTQSGHGEGRKTAEHWSVPIARKAMGGSMPIVAKPMSPHGGMGSSMMPATRPIMPRPHVMPNMMMKQPKMNMHLAKGGTVDSGNSLQEIGPYSVNEQKHPTPKGRPGYKKGGPITKKAVKKIADQEVGKHVASPKPAGHGQKKGTLAFMREPLCGGGKA